MEISKKQAQTSARPELKFIPLDEEEMSKLTGGSGIPVVGGLLQGGSGVPVVGGLLQGGSGGA